MLSEELLPRPAAGGDGRWRVETTPAVVPYDLQRKTFRPET
jgi:hypothetical protein